MTNFELQLQRVNRHFATCCEAYDPIGLLDLTHSLRVVGESKDELQTFLSARGIHKLRHTRPTKKLSRLLNEKSFVMALLPSMLDMKEMSVGEIIVINDFLGAEHSSTVSPPSWPSKFLSIADWFKAEAVIWRSQPRAPKLSLSRERLIKRVANYLGPSHSVRADQEPRSVDDVAIGEFSKIEVADRPLPYYAVMSIAQEILRAAGLVEPTK